MRLIGLTLCLLASSFGARAESIEDRMASLERQVKTLDGRSSPRERRNAIRCRYPGTHFTNFAAVSSQRANPGRKLTTGDLVETKTTNNQLTRK